MPRWGGAALLITLALLTACAGSIPRVARQVPARGNALLTGVHPGPALDALTISPANARAALDAFAASCPRLALRSDPSGLTRPGDWSAPCQAAATWPRSAAARFFETWFDSARVGTGASFVTGYFEPEIDGVRQKLPGFDVPVYRLPPDLVRARAGDAALGPDGRTPLGRYDAKGRFTAYWDRAQIEDGALSGQGLELAWAADPVALFFVQVQGSGRLRAPDGTIMRIGYAGENGWPYTGVGSVMNARGLIGGGPGQYWGSMQGIERYIRDHPDEGRALLRTNRSYVFFRDTTAMADAATGPVGALSVAVAPRVTLAVDPAFVPLGAPVFLTTDDPVVGGLWVAQDTGGAIKGPNRFDSFWGAGAEARRVAGGMSAHGRALILLPRGALARLTGQ